MAQRAKTKSQIKVAKHVGKKQLHHFLSELSGLTVLLNRNDT